MADAPDAWDPNFTRLHPAFAVLEQAHAPFARSPCWPSLDAWNDERREHLPAFVVDRKRPRRSKAPRTLDSQYDARIVLANEVPSRPQNWHDYLNMLVWRTFPLAKRALHRAQYEALRADLGDGEVDRLPNARSRTRDKLTMLDEGGLLRVESAHVLFGHAVYEHLLSGHLGALRVAVPSMGAVDALRSLDAAFAAWLERNRMEAALEASAFDIATLGLDAWWRSERA